jgi:hypothetical protein
MNVNREVSFTAKNFTVPSHDNSNSLNRKQQYEVDSAGSEEGQMT